MTTPAMPELPEPELGYIETDKSRQPAFSAAQMRAALQSAQQAVPMTDEQVKSARRSVCDDPDELPEPWAFRMGIRAAEAHHGITAQGAQEGV